MKKKDIPNKVVTAPVFQLYKIHQEIENLVEGYIDQESGEIGNVANAHLNALSIKREDAIHQIGLVHLVNKAKIDAVNSEIKRLQSLKKGIENRAEAAKRIIENDLQDGEIFEYDNLKLSWKKNPPSVDVDPELDLSTLLMEYPEIVNVEYSVNKTEVKALSKIGKPLPQGIKIIDDKKSLQIK